jgi:O-antigen ligase
MIDNRYSGKNARGVKKQDISAGRLGLVIDQFNGFSNAPVFGIGVGNGKFKRAQRGDLVATSHNEVTRLIEEHGLIGLFILIMLLIVPIAHFSKLNNFQRSLLIPFYVFWFLTINHSAMRIAFPGFIYALSLISIVHEED